MSVKEYWPEFVKAHADPYNRAFHLAGLVGGLAALVWALDLGTWWVALLAPVIYYGSSFFGHLVFEKSGIIFFSSPVKSTLCTAKMFYHMLTGTWFDEHFKIMQAEHEAAMAAERKAKAESEPKIKLVKTQPEATSKKEPRKPAAKKTGKKAKAKDSTPVKKPKSRRHRTKQ